MSRYLNDEEYSAARQALVDAGYSESGADTELEKHQEKYRSTTDSLVKHFNDSSAQRLALEGIGAALATYGAVEAGKGIYNRMFKKPESSVQAVEPSLDMGKPLANRVGSEPVLFEDTTFSPEKVPGVPTREEVPSHIPATDNISKKDVEILGNIEKGEAVSKVTEAAGKAPPAGKKKAVVPTFKTAADIPEGMVFRPDVGNLDRSLVNILGTEGRLYAKDVLNKGQSFGTYKGADYNKKISELVNAYGEELKKITPSIDLTTREGRVAVGAPHTKNYGSALGKAAKVGGVLGTLMTVAQSANAKEAAQAVGESLLPIGVTPSELQSGKLTEKQLRAYAEAQKLGSPYRSVPPPK